jgi:hypothetical protein
VRGAETGGCYVDAPDAVTLAGALNRMRCDGGARVLVVEDQCSRSLTSTLVIGIVSADHQ